LVVNPRSLQTVLKSFANAESLVNDDELLRRFTMGDERPFSELVRRHGRLVWAVCRHLTGSDADADDAFQATFLVLIRNARRIRDARRLSAWLHGVAFKVCARARRTAQRRTTREQAVATSERNGSVVPDSAWDRALSAVHEEAGALPDTLRLPFVLCCLEGKGVTEAAEQLGWKLGTFSGRLTRAKDAILVRLNARGLTIGVVAGLGLAAPPATAVAKAVAQTQIGFVVPPSVLQLTQGVIGMTMTSSKLIAAVLLTCGLGLGASSGWMATADAQPPVNPVLPGANPEAEVKRLQAELEIARQQLTAQAAWSGSIAAWQKASGEAFVAKTTKWEYDFVAVSDITQTKFVEFLQDRENRGWEFNGTTTFKQEGKPTAIWVFRRPAKGTSTPLQQPSDYYFKLWQGVQTADQSAGNKLTSAKAIESEIAKLQEKLATLKANWSRVVFMKETLPLNPIELGTLLVKLADKKFEKGQCLISSSENGIAVEGNKEVIEWVTALIKKISEK
jgi:RNA polymerase sigma factor (sigma-70 family)